mmetsp:Transcript_84350/g.188345  ORF Transcript_84350/g.188345 Transcript_84350/m.188345 type:complete len:743 (-) Transcript_84350:66-2294(-)
MPSFSKLIAVGGATLAAGLTVPNNPSSAAIQTDFAADAIAFATKTMHDKSQSSLKRANALLSQMSSQEKVNMLHGACMSCPYVGLIPGTPRLGIPSLNMHDGPQGFRNEPGASGTSTSWPGAMGMAATFDPEAVYEWGNAMGQEFVDKGANVQLGPGLNLARVPVNGRNFEYLAGEDPYLGYVLAKPVTKGIQDNKVIACGKHYVGNSQEEHRMDISEDVDERTLFEMYYPPFEAAVEAGIGSMMCSYNRLNGTYSCENSVTLGHLKKELGFNGFVMSDWGATHNPSLKEGLDMEMPMGFATHGLNLLMKGVKEEDLNNAVRRTLHQMYQVGVMDMNQSVWDPAKFAHNVSTAEHINLARKLGSQATVLLKNEREALPLPQGAKIAVIGFASENGRVVSFGHGSGEVSPSYYVSPLTGITEAAGEGAQVRYDSGKDMNAAIKLAEDSDYAIVFVGGSATEGGDRKDLNLDGACRIRLLLAGGKVQECEGNDDNQNKLVSEVAKVNKRTIVVASVPGAFLTPWSKEVASLLVNFMPGQEAGHAIADVLFGKVNPSAKLPITLPNKENEINFASSQYPGEKRDDKLSHSVYSEQLLVGYRYYDAHNIEFDTGFPFGHGLSYTEFTYSAPQVVGRGCLARACIRMEVANTGRKPGAEVVQAYLQFAAAESMPSRVLRSFHKTSVLQPGQKEEVFLVLTPRDLSTYHNSVGWVEQHNVKVDIGSSSVDIRQSVWVNVEVTVDDNLS